MIKYRLDELGWYQFESLIQSLLKAEVGIAVESWGGHSDRGRDAFANTSLRFPDKQKPTKGPFVFQAKFVESANAKGARPRRALLTAIKAEALDIKRRQTAAQWENTSWYVLLTNAPLPSSTRAAIIEILKSVLLDTKVVTLGGKDICGMLDNHPELRRSFPEIMSLRDLDTLLRNVVARSVIERSKSAIEEAREVVSVFVQTENYHKAIQILKKHNFVVLDGPPEMGKTAIARVLSFAQLTLGWEALDCRSPDDLFLGYDVSQSQIFVVDDAFGRGEYEPTFGRLWEKDLSKALHKIDHKHWLIWTTRKHVLSRALKDMDLEGKATSFPAPGEVIVTAEDLSTEEKAKILYRHAKGGQLATLFRSLVRIHASLIVRDDHFTPERIRRFIEERVPELAAEHESKPLTADELKKEIIEAIHNPTKRMRKAFNKLPEIQKWILIALLDCEAFPVLNDLQLRYNQHRPQLSEAAFVDALDDLVGTFVKLRTLFRREYIDWIHPSYRDLVIDELMSDLKKQVKFVGNASTIGVSLALSEAGGAAGKRALPFLSSPLSWTALTTRVLKLLKAKNQREIARILRPLSFAFSSDTVSESAKRKIQQILSKALTTINNLYVNSKTPLDIDTLRTYLSARSRLEMTVGIPTLELAWETETYRLREMLESGDFVSQFVVDAWSKLARVIEMYVPTFFQNKTRRQEYHDDREQLTAAINAELHSVELPDDADEISEAADRLRSLAGSMEELAFDEVIGDDHVTRLAGRLETKAERFEEEIKKEEAEDNDGDTQPIKTDEFDINALFDDL
jgi:hypothetical protein